MVNIALRCNVGAILAILCDQWKDGVLIAVYYSLFTFQHKIDKQEKWDEVLVFVMSFRNYEN